VAPEAAVWVMEYLCQEVAREGIVVVAEVGVEPLSSSTREM